MIRGLERKELVKMPEREAGPWEGCLGSRGKASCLGISPGATRAQNPHKAD